MHRVLLLTIIDVDSYDHFGYSNGDLNSYLKPTDKLITSIRASKRLREDLPLNYLSENKNYTIDVFCLGIGSKLELLNGRNYTHILIPKISAIDRQLSAFSDKVIRVLEVFVKAGCKIILDYTNEIISTDPRFDIYNKLIKYVNAIVVPSLYMYESNYVKTALRLGKKVFYIDDPLEVTQFLIPREINPQSKLKIICFGGGHSYSAFSSFLNKICMSFADLPTSIEFHLVFEKQYLARLSQVIPPEFASRFKLICWKSQPQLIDLMSTCNIAFIPSYNKYASTNRVTLSLSLGLLPITSPVPSYSNLASNIQISTNPVQAIGSLIQNYNQVKEKLITSRKEILEPYLPVNIAKDWHEAFLNA